MLPMNRLKSDPSGRYLISVSEGIRVLQYTDDGSLRLVTTDEGIYNALAVFASP